MRVLESEAHPLSAQEILERAGALCPGIGAATVFRALKQLLESGEISRVELPGVPPHYELAAQDHRHFFVCETCKQLLPLRGCVGGLSKLLPAGSRMKHHEIVIYGECADCDQTG
jgi:Fur family ferric uptake transcriptional regulator